MSAKTQGLFRAIVVCVFLPLVPYGYVVLHSSEIVFVPAIAGWGHLGASSKNEFKQNKIMKVDLNQFPIAMV